MVWYFLDHACTPATDHGAQTWQTLTLRRICAAIPLHVRAGITLLHTSLSLRKALQLDVRSQHHWAITLVHFFILCFVCVRSPTQTESQRSLALDRLGYGWNHQTCSTEQGRRGLSCYQGPGCVERAGWLENTSKSWNAIFAHSHLAFLGG